MATITVPLTTIFTPPPNCASHWTYEPSATDGNDVPGGLLLQRAQGSPFVPNSVLDPTCFPGLGDAWGRVPGTTALFSPGICPYDWTTAMQSNGPTTTGTCCPVGFEYTATQGTLNGGTALTGFYGCTSLWDSDTPTSVFAISPYGKQGVLDGTVGPVTTLSDPVIMWAVPIIVAYQDSDLDFLPMSTTSRESQASPTYSTPLQTFGSSTAPSTSSDPSPSTEYSQISSPTPTSPRTSASPLQSDNSSSPTPHSPSSMSNGAIAGIAIGAAALLALLIGAFLLLRRRKSKQMLANTPSAFTTPSSFGSDFEPYKDHGQAELVPNTVIHEDPELVPNSGRYGLEPPNGRGAELESPWLREN